MSLSEPDVVAARTNTSYVQWSGVIAGAVIAAAISFVLMSFGSAIGLAVAPLSPSWRTSSMLLEVLSGVWILVIAVGALSAGGYIAGRMRSTWSHNHTDEVEFRDGVHGLVVWALSITLGGALAALSATVVLAVAAAGGRDGANASAPAPVVYEVDRLFRSDARPVEVSPSLRDEAGRLLNASTNDARFNVDDRVHLSRMVMATTGIDQEAALARVAHSIASVRDKLSTARHAAIILAFITAASLLAGAAAAWEAACIGGRHRDSAAPPSLAWRGRKPRVQLT